MKHPPVLGDAYREAYAKAQRGEPLTRADLVALTGYRSDDTFARHRHEFERFKLKPAIGQLEYSGVLVYRHLTRGTDDVAPDPEPQFTFGRKTFAKRRP
jgi:hypothetical protein